MIVESAEDILDQIHKDDFIRLVDLAQQFENVPKDFLIQQYETGNEVLTQLQDLWVESLKKGSPDYSVYTNPAYLNESFVCWKQYARRYIRLLQKYLTTPSCVIDKDKIHTILDLGCGCAYSTVGLKAVFENACVVGTNLRGTLQFKIDEAVTDNIDGCSMLNETDTLTLPSVDMIFASEFFEHLTEPIDLLAALLDTYNPEYIVFANTFTRMSIGHFYSYAYDGHVYEGKEITRIFGTYLRKHGYVRVHTGFFNGRPQIYYKRPKFVLHRLFEVEK